MRKLLKKIIEILDGTPVVYGKKQRGQSLIETAMVIPVLAIMIAGLVEIGWFAQNYLNLLEAAKVGARRGPFLTDINGAPMWDHDASLAPIAANAGKITEKSYTFRNLDPTTGKPFIENGRCAGMVDTDFGFFNLVTCTVLDAMDPLEINWGNGKDDIVVSAFSIQRADVGDPRANHDIDLNNWPEGNSTTYPNGHQVIVVGRWPHNANECVSGGNAVERDPFDYITNGKIDWKYVPNPEAGGPDVRMVYEMGVWSEEDRKYYGYQDTGEELQRGFAWTGQHKIESDGSNFTCYGSEFTSEEVEELMNLPHFIRDTDPPLQGDVPDWTQERLSHLPSQGMVLVEVYWQHTMILGDVFPVWSPMYGLLGGGDPNSTNDVIKVWAAFPAPSAEPALLFQPPAPDS